MSKDPPSLINHFCSQDFLVTDDYIRHQNFYFTVLLGNSLNVLFTVILVLAEPMFLYIASMITYWYPVYFLFWLFTVTNNIYQVYAHIFTATKFQGIRHIVPYGSSDKQTMVTFNVSNIFDILGWLCLFMLHNDVHPFFALLAGSHFGTGLVSIFFNKTFQQYYIEEPSDTNKHQIDTFNYNVWRASRTIFVTIDAISRGILTYYLF